MQSNDIENLKQTEIRINIEDKAQAKKDVQQVQQSFNDLLDVLEIQSKQLKENLKVIDEAQNEISVLTKTAFDFADALKNIHRVLGSKLDLFKEDKDMNELMGMLNTFVVSSGAIKLGVLSKKEKENEVSV